MEAVVSLDLLFLSADSLLQGFVALRFMGDFRSVCPPVRSASPECFFVGKGLGY